MVVLDNAHIIMSTQHQHHDHDNHYDAAAAAAFLRAQNVARNLALPPVALLINLALGDVTREAAADAARALFDLHLYNRGVRFEFNNRLSRTQGKTSWRLLMPTRTIMSVTIQLNARTLPEVTGLEIYTTLLHEIAHAQAGPNANHGPAWRAAIYRIGGQVTASCPRPHVVHRARLTCSVEPSAHFVDSGFVVKPSWRARHGMPCLCSSSDVSGGPCPGTLQIQRLTADI